MVIESSWGSGNAVETYFEVNFEVMGSDLGKLFKCFVVLLNHALIVPSNTR